MRQRRHPPQRAPDCLAVPDPRSPIEPAASRFDMPNPARAEPGEDLIAVGADLEPGTLLAAYRRGLFPMPVDPHRRRSAIAWYSPDPRGIVPLDALRVTRSMRRSRRRFDIRMDTAFDVVVKRCGDPARPGRWINDQIVSAYTALFELGWAHSIETFVDDRLVGGLYGVRIGGLFAGESMFHDETDASKVALVALVEWLTSTGGCLLDVQWATEHLASLGAVSIPRLDYLAMLATVVDPLS